MSGTQLAEFLQSHPDMLEKYIVEHAELDQLERWCSKYKKGKKAPAGGKQASGLSKWKVGHYGILHRPLC